MKKIIVIDNKEERGRQIRDTLRQVLTSIVIVHKKEISEIEYSNSNYEAVFFHHNNTESQWIIERKQSSNSPPIVAFSGEAFNCKQKRDGYFLYRPDHLENPENIEFILSEMGIKDG